MKKIIFSALLICAITPFKLLAQDNVIDEVIWVVGDESILRSEIEQAILSSKAEGNPIQGDPYCVLPEQIAIQKLFLHQAALDSIQVNEGGVNTEVEYYLNRSIAQSGSVERFEDLSGMKVTVYREFLREKIRERNIVNQMQQKLVGDIKSTPSDVRRFFNQLPTDSIPTVPSNVELQIVSFEPPVAPDEIKRIKDRLRDFTDRITSGASDFSVLARLYSEDIESSKRGGELGFMGRGQLVPEFSSVAFNMLDPKKVSRVVQTEFGYHIIQLIEKRGDRINCRHILLKPRVSLDEKNKAVHVLDSIANQIRTGKMTFEHAVLNFSQDKNSAMNAGLMLNDKTNTSKFEYQDLPAEIGKVVYGMNVGEVSKPFVMMNPTTNKEVVAVVKLKSKVDNHKANLTDDYQMLRNFFEGKKKEEFLHNWIIKKQKETYISIDPQWQKCKFQYPGWIKK